jgi:hypothetical protein
MLTAALDYAARGYVIVPLWEINDVGSGPQCACPYGVNCDRAGKHPWLWNWRNQATGDPDVIGPWFRLRPRSGIGWLMGGQHRLVAIDVDGDAGRASLAALVAEHGELPPTLTQITGRGQHVVYTVPGTLEIDRISSRTRLAPGIDIRCQGTFIVAAPSLHVSGVRYCLRDPHQPIAELPLWLYAIMIARPAARPFGALASRPDDVILPSVEERDVRARAYIRHRPAAVAGDHGHDAAFAVALDLVRGFVLPLEIAFQIMLDDYNPRCAGPWSENEIAHKIEDAEAATQVGWGYRLMTDDAAVSRGAPA